MSRISSQARQRAKALDRALRMFLRNAQVEISIIGETKRRRKRKKEKRSGNQYESRLPRKKKQRRHTKKKERQPKNSFWAISKASLTGTVVLTCIHASDSSSTAPCVSCRPYKRSLTTKINLSQSYPKKVIWEINPQWISNQAAYKSLVRPLPLGFVNKRPGPVTPPGRFFLQSRGPAARHGNVLVGKFHHRQIEKQAKNLI